MELEQKFALVRSLYQVALLELESFVVPALAPALALLNVLAASFVASFVVAGALVLPFEACC